MAALDPVCPACGLGCGVRRCKTPGRRTLRTEPDVCCEECPELARYQLRQEADRKREAHNRAIWDKQLAPTTQGGERG